MSEIQHADGHTAQSRFFEAPMETKIGEKNQRVREICDKGIAFEWGEENDFWFKLSRDLKKMGLREILILL